MNWLKKQGAKNIILVGHSRGGNQTAWYASEHDSPIISKIILIAPQIWSTEYAEKGYKKRFGKNLDTVLNNAQALVDDHKGQSFLDPVDFIYCKDTKATAEAFVSYYNNDLRKDTIFVLPKIKKPVLIFAGTEDTVVKNLDKKIDQMSPQDNIKLEVMDGADHSFRDLYSEEIVESSVEFINSTQ
ncbi:MAG: alpha/beta hydrolase [gamma proteobacterium symbiont of Bathyaustriella thionipta]|nr:alpha/beta hydrolase [gamma proteobacterium symbiont of Bathyaustriella thionipta]MCU7951549.1 alpha/beta hydrolase [gamma proteobacterium symbiont of Bathyaustriella thionipta]MCU7953939.1 alpha/beta hydrolase [gamma proteobacterium symbiont of Bathyaustriella thionipta]MCU7958141.1 alpha/beta hydrolase [gamma proteobacterium symbiont of Bathyaustriella thionipta]MCU7966094.1 alpha/beta hydrolase [gamma proteobacterium symbiont of Bathyaustriella thionipta]